MAKTAIDAALFWDRAGRLTAGLPAGVNALALVRGTTSDDDPVFLRTYTLQAYLTGKEFANTIIVLTRDGCHIAASQKMCDSALSAIKTGAPRGKTVTYYPCVPKKDENAAALERLAAKVREVGGVLGVIKPDLPKMQGDFFAAKFVGMLSGIETADCTGASAQVLRSMDAAEMKAASASGEFLSEIYQKVALRKIHKCLRESSAKKHSELSSLVAVALEDPAKAKVKGLRSDVPTDGSTILPFDPVFQSGGKYKLGIDLDHTSDGRSMEFDSIIVTMAVRLRQYCSFVGRTLLVDPSDDKKEVYRAALAARDAVRSSLRPGTPFSEVYAAARNALPDSMQDCLHGGVGWVCGIEWKDDDAVLSPSSKGAVSEGNCFVTIVTLKDVDVGGTPLTVQFVDTVVVSPDGTELVTDGAEIDDVDDAGEDDAEPVAPMEIKLRDSTEKFESGKTAKWIETQNAILEANRREWKETGGQAEQVKDFSFAGKLARGKIVPYRKGSTLAKGTSLEVDERHQSVLLPISGSMVPFHASTLKGTTSRIEDGRYVLSVDFLSMQETYTPFRMFPSKVFVKQLTFRTDIADKADLETKRAQIRRLIAAIKKGQEQASAETLEPQADLQKRPGGPLVRLREVFVKPAVTTGKGAQRCLGDVEAHQNGLRFTGKALVGKAVDVMYSNIKHLLVIPSRTDRFAAIHCVLNSDILLPNQKKSGHIQFWVETEVEGDDIVAGRHKTDDEEDAEDEQRQITKEKINKEFINFGKALRSGTELAVEMPFREAWFDGHAFSSEAGMASLACTANTISAVIETNKFFVLTMPEIEVVIFERVVQGRLNFDATFVNKDYRKPVQQIYNISGKFLPLLKDLCCSVYKTKFYETPQTNNWKEIMKVVVKAQQTGDWDPWAPPQAEDEDGDEEGEESGSSEDGEKKQGWETMFNHDDEEDSSEEDSDQDSEDEESEEDDDTSMDSADSSDEGEEMDEDTSDSDVINDWSDAEREAQAHDRKRKYDDDDSPKKKRARHAAPPAKGRSRR